MFSAQHNFNLEEEEEDATIDDALLGELDDDDALLDEEVDPLVKDTIDPLTLPGEDEDVGEKTFEEGDDEEDEDLDYDSFDDRDEM